MIQTKQEFVKTFLPDSYETIHFAQIDLDISDLSLADVLRNVNKTFPTNTRNRNRIASANLAVGILCTTELLDPLSGLLLIITDEDTEIEIVSANYMVIAVPESKIKNDEDIKEVIDMVTKYLLESFKDGLLKFNEFYVKFIYDPYEMERLEEDDEY